MSVMIEECRGFRIRRFIDKLGRFVDRCINTGLIHGFNFTNLNNQNRAVRLTTSQIKCCPGPRRPQFLYQSTHRHPFITRRLFPECHTSIYMVKHQISTRVDRHGRQPLHQLAVHPSMHLSDPGGVRNSVSHRWRPVAYSQSGYAFRKTSLSLETFILTPAILRFKTLC